MRLHDDKNKIKKILHILFKETKLGIDDRVAEINKLVNDFAAEVNKAHIEIWKEIRKYNDENYEIDFDGFKRIP